jgi:voltage-gated potassium channel Kch
MLDTDATAPSLDEYQGTVRNGYVELEGPVNWPDGTRVVVRVATPAPAETQGKDLGPVIIAGFGLAGRWVADIFDRHGIEYTLVDSNPQTVEVQRGLGRSVIEGDIADEETLRRAGIREAAILALTVPNEQVVLRATELARRLKPDIYIVARTTHSSAGMEASRLGADEVVKAEQAVARQFYEMLLRKLNSHPTRADAEVAGSGERA